MPLLMPFGHLKGCFLAFGILFCNKFITYTILIIDI
jgi:hypothetical protein